jgi:sulfocyanin
MTRPRFTSWGAFPAPLLVFLLSFPTLSGCREASDVRSRDARTEAPQRTAPADPGLPAASSGTRDDAPASAETAATPEPDSLRRADASSGAAAVTGAAADRAGGGQGEVEWMQVDEAKKKVNFDVVAGLTADNSAWNFNGYANGAMTITVPQGWTVTMKFSSRDADVPHSLYIIDEKPPYPAVMPETPAIPKAYSINLKNGIGPGKSDVLRFTSDKAGEFSMACGVPGHSASGMWDHFVISAGAVRPSVTFEK